MQELSMSKDGKIRQYDMNGNSMMPMISRGDVMDVNTEKTNLIDGGIYLLSINGKEKTVRQYRKTAAGSLFIPHNVCGGYVPEFIPSGNEQSVKIIGQVEMISRCVAVD